MKKSGLFLLFLFISVSTFAQSAILMTENEPSNYEGLECGYNIRNEQTKEAGGEKYSRYEVNMYITNRSGCPKIMLINTTNTPSSSSGYSANTFAIFNCLNANGKRLTSKSASVNARDFYVPVKLTEKNAEGKDVVRIVNAHAGYILRDGESINTNAIFIVPLGERPRMQCQVVMLSNF